MVIVPAIDESLFEPGLRIAVALSGGADSVALFRRLLEERARLGIVLSVVHMNHGIRARAAEDDAEFVASIAREAGLPLYFERADVPRAAAEQKESIEDAARRLRYAFFARLLAERAVDAVATAHTLDDQAETVLHKLIRGAWTEGLSGIHPVVLMPGGRILRPFLAVTRSEIETWLRHLGQNWREDETNHDPAYTRNRIRHELIPLLRTFNPEIARQLSRVAAIALDEEQYWQDEMDRLLPRILLPGKAARGGGRASSTLPGEACLAIEAARLRELPRASARRVLRGAAARLGVRLGFDHTERLLRLAESGSGNRAWAPAPGARGAKGTKRPPRRIELPGGLIARRTPREVLLSVTAHGTDGGSGI